MQAADRLQQISSDPERMRAVATETLRRMAVQVRQADLSVDDRAVCLSVLRTGSDAVVFSYGEPETAQTFLLAAAFGAALAVAQILEGGHDTELLAGIKTIGAQLAKRGASLP